MIWLFSINFVFTEEDTDIRGTDIQKFDNDNQEAKISYEENVCYSTWNVLRYYYETVSSPKIVFGNKELYFKYNKVYNCDAKDLYLGLFNAWFEYPAI